MSNPVVTGCRLPIFGEETCENTPTIYYSSQNSISCPGGSFGGPFTSPAGKFTSLISQADADAQAASYLNSMASRRCLTSVISSVIFEMLGPYDDDVRIQINGTVPTQAPLGPYTIYYWDYNAGAWSTSWTASGYPTAIPGGGQTVFPVISMNRNWNVGWYGGASYAIQNFIKIKYTGFVQPGDFITIDLVDSFQFGYGTFPWKATVNYVNGSSKIINGGSTFSGISPIVPSPPRINPASASPYDTVAHYQAFFGLPDYHSQGYPNSGPFYSDIYNNGSFVVPSP